MNNILEFQNHGELYHYILNELDTNSNVINYNNSVNANELNYLFAKIKDPTSRCEFQSMSAMFFDMVETIFSLSGRIDSFVITRYKSELKLYEDNGIFRSAVSSRLFEFYGDQIDRCYKELTDNPNSRKAFVNMMEKDFSLFPCTIFFQYLIVDGKLDLYVNFRTSDPIRYLNADIFMYSVLQELMANWLKTPIGSLYYHASSVHVFDHMLDRLEILKKRGVLIDYINNEQMSKKIPLIMEYKDWKQSFSTVIDILYIWHKEDLKDCNYHLNQIENLNLPHFLNYWLKLLLIERLYKLNRNDEINKILELLEESDLKSSLIYFLNNKVDPVLEVVSGKSSKNLSATIRYVKRKGNYLKGPRDLIKGGETNEKEIY